MTATSVHPARPFKLGRNKPLARGMRLRFGDFLLASAPPPPPATENYLRSGSGGVYAAMEDVLANDAHSCCTCSGAGHILDILRANSAKPWRHATAADVLAFYARVTNPPFNPETGENDNGADEQTVLNVWKGGFFQDGSGKIEAWATLNASSPLEIKQALWLFGNVYFGVPMPDAWVSPMPSASGFVWGPAGAPDDSNGHAFIGYGYNASGVFIDTWGLFGTVTWEAIAKYCAAGVGELHVVLGEEWADAAATKAPGGVNVSQLRAYIATLF